MSAMIPGPSKRISQLVSLGRARLPTNVRSYASSSKGKAPRKHFDPVIFTGIQPTGLSALSMYHDAGIDWQERLMYVMI